MIQALACCPPFSWIELKHMLYQLTEELIVGLLLDVDALVHLDEVLESMFVLDEAEVIHGMLLVLQYLEQLIIAVYHCFIRAILSWVR